LISLRNRAIAGAAVWVSLVIVLGTYLMGGYLREQTTVWFDDELVTRHAQAVVALANSEGDPALLEAQLNNASYLQPFSGQYWQFDNGEVIIASRSLIDGTLPLERPASPELRISAIAGPSGQIVRSTAQIVALANGEEWTVQVASSVGPLLRDQEQLTQRLNVGYVSMAAFGTFGAMVLVLATLRPLSLLREEQGQDAQNSLSALDSLDAQLQRSLARIRAVKSGALQHGGIEVSQPLNRMGRAFSGLAKNKDRSLDSQIEDGLRAKIDVHDLNEICGNLLDNALKWSKDKIGFAAEMDARGIVISIADDGPGIPKEMREKVLSGGTRLDETTPGTGLGLAIAADLVTAYEGTLDIDASPLLGGSLITIRLPGSRAAPAAAA